MKVTYYALIFMLCLNGATMLLNGLEIVGVPIDPWNPDQVESSMNATEVVESLDWFERTFYDVGAGLGFFWSLNVPVIESFTGTLQAYGCPGLILNPIRLIWRFIWVGFVICFISGRNFMP